MSLWMPRRQFLGLAGASAVGLWACRKRTSVVGSGLSSEKASDLVVLTERPPNIEMPSSYLVHDLTPNEAMFVRWHSSGVPTEVDTRLFRLTVGGHVDRELSLSLEDLQRDFQSASVVAVNQCSGNGRGTFSPRVPGLQWGDGAVGNARWTGVRLADLLAKAGVKPEARSVAFGGLDRPAVDTVPDYVKSLDVDAAQSGGALVAWGMNDSPLPMLNGFPLRLVMPGWYSTYWVKALDSITVLPKAFDGYWVAKAYRIPKTEGAVEEPSSLATETVPISRMNVRSRFARPFGRERVPRGRTFTVEGVAFDGGSGIARVEVSTDGGSTFQDAALGPDLGGFSFRRFRLSWTPMTSGPATLVVRATSRAGETQRTATRWNRAGYMKNDPEHIEVVVL